MSSNQKSASWPSALVFAHPIVMGICDLDGRCEKVQFFPIGSLENQFEILMARDDTNQMPQRILLPRMPSVWEQCLAMVIAGATEAMIPSMPQIQPLLWRTAFVEMQDFEAGGAAKLTVAVSSHNWTATLSGNSRSSARAQVPTSSLRYQTVGWILAEMASTLILREPGFEARFLQVLRDANLRRS
jgi:hypothetical protein